MERMLEEWKKELIEAGKLKPGQEISQQELVMLWESYSVEKLMGAIPGRLAEAQASRQRIGSNVNPHEGIKLALNALIKKAKGSSYCMIVVDSAWINFRFKRSKNNLHLQVAGNQYINPKELSISDVKKLESMGIPAEKYSIDIYATDFDDEPRDLDMIADRAIEIFNEVYHIREGERAYMELEMDKGEDESTREEISQYFQKRDGKKFKWDW